MLSRWWRADMSLRMSEVIKGEEYESRRAVRVRGG